MSGWYWQSDRVSGLVSWYWHQAAQLRRGARQGSHLELGPPPDVVDHVQAGWHGVQVGVACVRRGMRVRKGTEP